MVYSIVSLSIHYLQLYDKNEIFPTQNNDAMYEIFSNKVKFTYRLINDYPI